MGGGDEPPRDQINSRCVREWVARPLYGCDGRADNDDGGSPL